METECFSRNDILSWINDTLKLNLTKIEQLGTGAVYCQIVDYLYPGKVPLSKVNWKAKHEYEFIYNFKILQQSFTKLGIQKHIELEKLVKAKYQDNLEFAQWLKKYFDSHHTTSRDYDAVTRRGVGEVEIMVASKLDGKSSGSKGSIKGKIPVPKTGSYIMGKKDSFVGLSKATSITGLNNKEIDEKLSANKNPFLAVAKSERDFYFSKLKEIDVMLENCKDNATVEDLKKNIKSILYEMPEEISIIDFITARKEVSRPTPTEEMTEQAVANKVDVVNVQFEEEDQEKSAMLIESQS